MKCRSHHLPDVRVISVIGKTNSYWAVKRFKNHSPQRHREHREKPVIVNRAAGAVNNINLCALCGEKCFWPSVDD